MLWRSSFDSRSSTRDVLEVQHTVHQVDLEPVRPDRDDVGDDDRDERDDGPTSAALERSYALRHGGDDPIDGRTCQ